jgi:outer membrane protein TolC
MPINLPSARARANTSLSKSSAPLLLAGALSLFTGCASVTPRAATPPELAEATAEVRRAAEASYEPITGALSLEEAMARALKHNLDYRTKLMEEALALNLLDVTKGDMLPKLLGQAGYTARNNDRISLSRDATIDGSPLLPSRFISQERTHTASELGLSWSILDFGLGYYNSRQQADRVLVAAERRRKAMHLLMQDVRIAFWRLASAQQLEARLKGTIAAAEAALADSRGAEAARVRNPAENMRYQRQILENLRVLEAVSLELSSAEIQLGTLINAPAGQSIRVVVPTYAGVNASISKLPVEKMEELALVQNPDWREQHYNVRIARLEARKALTRMFPNLTFSYAYNYDTDRYLVNNQWNQAGISLSYNFMTLLSYNDVKRYANAGVELAKQRHVTAHMATLAQVHLARLNLLNAAQQLGRAKDIYDVDRRLADLSTDKEAAQAQSKLERVSAETVAILSELRHFQALAQVQAAEARLTAVLGAEPQIPSVTETPLKDLIKLLGAESNWNHPAVAAN